MEANGVKNSISIALFGAGFIGSVHLKDILLNGRAQLRYLVEARRGLAENILKRYNLEKQVTVCGLDEIEKVLTDDRVDAVMVCTPTDTHFDISCKAIKHGKAVFCEKPLGLTFEEVKDIYAAAKSKGVPLFCAFNRRFDPQYRAIYETMKDSSMGKVRAISVTSLDDINMHNDQIVRESECVMMNSVIHDLDLVCWMADCAPSSVFAAGAATIPVYKEVKDYDTISVVLKFPNDVIGTIEFARGVKQGYDQRVEVQFEDGRMNSYTVCKEAPSVLTKDAVTKPHVLKSIDRYYVSYEKELDHFIDLVLGQAKEEVTEDSTLLATRLAELCHQSCKDNSVIKL